MFMMRVMNLSHICIYATREQINKDQHHDPACSLVRSLPT